MTGYCRRCGTAFEPRKAYHRLCWPCWHADQDTQVKAESGQKDKDYRRGWSDGHEQGYSGGFDDGMDFVQDTKPQQPPLSRELLRDLIQLCHPDRHPEGRWDQSNRVTRQLIELFQNDRVRP